MYDYLFIADKSVDELLQLFNIEVNDDDFYDIIAFNLVINNSLKLIEKFKNFDEKRKKAIFIALRECKTNTVIKKFLENQLNLVNSNLKISIIDTLSYFKFDNYQGFDDLLNDKNIDVQCAAIRFFSKQKGVGFKKNLIKFLNSSNAKIRENAIDELDDLEEFNELDHIKNLEHLKPLLKDKNKKIRDLVSDILNRNIELYNLKKDDYFI